ncbi:hypothetical protein PF005_g11052 [Phytophthora fragariae]|uniref:Uncharacterized protein n=1 Tax=Phytophthora fragariae TaxID=53985 RepID=A0A6A3K0U8_9STRA|nr:hypothetical protein PF011_g14724 [Phytophthora fragariae]KAE9211309.1 hypothetical protein PF005_g11052 [Phytophthora fragariae]KAE9233445.1 hypothetical protein PF002_g12082 [Phytophthora fragariae]KAE9233900.1 hypothetical protein PF004_g9527 [Phytophthora fragariae]
MPHRPKNKNKTKLKSALFELSTVEAAAAIHVTRATIYRWRKDAAKLKEAATTAPNKYFKPSEPNNSRYFLYTKLEER